MRSLLIEPKGNNFRRNARQMSFTENRLEYLQQKVRSVLSLFFGEWYLDTSLGIPYIPATDSKIAHRFLIESRVQTKLMAIKGITKLIYFTPEYKSNERILSISFAAETDSGEILEMEEAWNMG